MWLKLLGGSWVVLCGVTGDLVWVINTVTLLITPLRSTHESPSKDLQKQFGPLLVEGCKLSYHDKDFLLSKMVVPTMVA